MKTVRLLAVVLLLLACSLGASAQREYSPNFSIGAKGGATLSRVAFTPEVHQRMVQGVTMGVTARYTEEKYFGLVAELNLTQRGWAEDFARDDAPGYDYKRQLTYVSLPLLTHIYFGSARVKCFFNLGPEIGLLLQDKISANFDYGAYESIPGFPQGYRTNKQLAMEVENKFDYGISGGAGVELFVNRRNSIQLQGRYYFGLGNIYGASKRDFFAGSRNSSIEITASYLFRVL